MSTSSSKRGSLKRSMTLTAVHEEASRLDDTPELDESSSADTTTCSDDSENLNAAEAFLWRSTSISLADNESSLLLAMQSILSLGRERLLIC